MYTFHIVSWRGKSCYRFLSGSISCGNSVREARSGLQSSSSTSVRCLWLYWNHGKEDDLRHDERGVRCKLAIHRRSGRNSACKKKTMKNKWFGFGIWHRAIQLASLLIAPAAAWSGLLLKHCEERMGRNIPVVWQAQLWTGVGQNVNLWNSSRPFSGNLNVLGRWEVSRSVGGPC